MDCFKSSDPAAVHATLLFDFNNDYGDLWHRDHQNVSLPSCFLSSSPPDSPCQVCLEQDVYVPCRNLTDGVKVMMEAGADQVQISKTGCPKPPSDDSHTGQLDGALTFLIILAVISILVFVGIVLSIKGSLIYRYEITPNCGYDDDGGRHEVDLTECKNNTFNNGREAYCQTCKPCPTGYTFVESCTKTADTVCEEPSRTRTPTAPVTDPATTQRLSTGSSIGTTTQTNQTSSLTTTTAPIIRQANHRGDMWAAPLAIFISISILLAVLFVCVIYLKRKRGQNALYNRRSSYSNAGFSTLSVPPGNNDLEDILSPNILSAPLQTVLDDLDVLEDLVILLDPESHGLKNTKHLASHCSFPSTWITYTYSMKDSKSPLKAVLEGVTSRQPDWTVGHLAKLLRNMERNDAVAVLAKLRLNEKDA